MAAPRLTHDLRLYAVATPTGARVVVVPGRLGYNDCTLAVWEKLHYWQTPRETAAALAGSMFGWNCPGALVVNYNEDGTPRKGPVRDASRG